MNNEFTAAERAAMLASMRGATSMFYARAVQTHCHAFIEFTGLMGEFLKICQRAEDSGDTAWPFANGHGENMTLDPHEIAYLREKLGCIFGEALFNQ